MLKGTKSSRGPLLLFPVAGFESDDSIAACFFWLCRKYSSADTGGTRSSSLRLITMSAGFPFLRRISLNCPAPFAGLFFVMMELRAQIRVYGVPRALP
jgi:hypothetical protein